MEGLHDRKTGWWQTKSEKEIAEHVQGQGELRNARIYGRIKSIVEATKNDEEEE